MRKVARTFQKLLKIMSDETFMRYALQLAEVNRGRTSPNPTVGALLVKGGKIIGKGFTQPPGGAHAEVMAIKSCGDNAEGATLYVTLEPCAHFGRTPPCTDLIIAQKIKRVCASMIDPNPLVSGRGFVALRSAGVEVEVGLLKDRAERLNEAYIKYVTTGFPFVILKLAQTLDGKIATANGSSRWITGDKSRERVHLLRSQTDAVMVGIGTVLADDPQLNVRAVGNHNPIKIVLDSRLQIPMTAKVLDGEKLILATTEKAPEEKIKLLKDKGVEIWTLPSQSGQVNLIELINRAGKEDITSILIEGGGHVAASALKAGIADRVNIFIAPKILGWGINTVDDLGIRKLAKVIRLRDIEIELIGDDVLYSAKVEYKL